jgi:hypothetical protein
MQKVIHILTKERKKKAKKERKLLQLLHLNFPKLWS